MFHVLCLNLFGSVCMELDLVLNWARRFLNLKKCVKVEIGLKILKNQSKMCT
jgi:hypothetical protein